MQKPERLLLHPGGAFCLHGIALVTQSLPIKTAICGMTIVALQSLAGRGNHVVDPPVHDGGGKIEAAAVRQA